MQRALQLGEAATGRAGHGPGAPVAQARRTAGEGTPGKSSLGAQRRGQKEGGEGRRRVQLGGGGGGRVSLLNYFFERLKTTFKI